MMPVNNCSLPFCSDGKQLQLGESRSLTQIFQRNLLPASYRLWACMCAFVLRLMGMMGMLMMVMGMMVMGMMAMVMMAMVMIAIVMMALVMIAMVMIAMLMMAMVSVMVITVPVALR
jgi:hypothetical protein